MKTAYKAVLAVAVAGAVAVLGAALWEGYRGPPAVSVPGTPDPKHGEYLIHAGGCIACHTEAATLKAKGPILGGGRGFATPFGTFYSPNITRDPVHGIGRWSDAAFVRAFREGRGPHGRNLYPAFPYTSFTGITDRDLLDLKAYIFSLPPLPNANKPHVLGFPFNIRFGLTFWKWLYFRRGPYRPDPTKSAEWNRGAYLVRSLGHCGECHTPRNAMGAMEDSMFLAGARTAEGDTAPNITPDPATGIGGWSESDIVQALKIGMTPDGDFLGSAMTEVVNNGTSALTDADLKAMAVYLKSIPAVQHKVEKKK
jgi:mono/diheme cytochrome c family protein